MPDLPDLSDEELERLQTAVIAELHRRQVLTDAPARVETVQTDAARKIDSIAAQYLAARDGDVDEASPPPWVDPSAPGGMPYPKDWPTTHGGTVYVSQVSHNVWEPGDPDDPQADRWWAPRTTAADSGAWAPWTDYQAGDERTHADASYRCTQAHHSQPGWEPPNVPALWELTPAPTKKEPLT